MTASVPSDALVEALNKEHIRINAVLPLLDPPAREQAAQAHLALSSLAERLADADARYDIDQAPAHLQAATEIFEQMRASPHWAQLPADERSRHCTRMARCLRERYELGGDANLLNQAIAVACDAVTAGEEAAGLSGNATDGETNLRGLLPSAVGRGVLGITAEMVRLARANAARVLPSALGVLAQQLTGRFERDGDRATIDQAIELVNRAVALLDAAEESVPSELRVYHGAALLLRFKRYGHPLDIDMAISALRAASAASTGDDLSSALDGLGCALVARAEIPGHQADLEEAVAVLEQAVVQGPASPWFRTDLAAALGARYAETGQLEDLRRAESLLREALAIVPASAPDRARIVQNLLAAQTGTLGDGDNGVRRARTVLTATSRGARARPARVGGLAASLIRVAETEADQAALAEAIGLLRDEVEEIPPASPDRPSLLAWLGRGLRVRYCLLGDPADLQSALDHASTAANSATGIERAQCLRDVALTRSLLSARSGSTEDARLTVAAFREALDAAAGYIAATVDTARDWAQWAAEQGDWDQAAAATGIATTAVERLERTQTSRADRELVLSRCGGLAAQTAVAQVQAGRPEEALRVLERGRLRLLAEALRDFGAPADSTRATIELARELPLAYVAVDAAGAAVLTIGPDGTVGSRFLGEVTSADLSWSVAEFGSAQLARAGDPERWQAVLRKTCRWLGETVWTAIRALLPDHSSGRDGAEIGVIPYGLLGLLPLHAAARPDPESPGGLRYALDDCAITIVPSARLVQDRRTFVGSSAQPSREPLSALVVDVGERPGFAPLEHVEEEAAAVLALIGEGRRLSGDEATREAVLDAVDGSDILHFACHGLGSMLDPRGARLLLGTGEELLAADLFDRNGLHARLAVLSACQTAVYGAALPDEMIGLPTTLLHSGVGGVMATIWEVNDVSSMLLVRRFYDEWKCRPTRPVVALRQAQLWLRDVDNDTLHATFPDVAQLRPPPSPALRASWNRARPFAGLEHWASFSYVGW